MTLESSTPPMITDPAGAAAAGKCYLARNRAADRLALDAFHPRECAWCDYPLEQLATWLAEFNRWAGWVRDEGRYTEPEVRRFTHLPRPEQRLRSFRAAYGPEADPAELRP